MQAEIRQKTSHRLQVGQLWLRWVPTFSCSTFSSLLLFIFNFKVPSSATCEASLQTLLTRKELFQRRLLAVCFQWHKDNSNSKSGLFHSFLGKWVCLGSLEVVWEVEKTSGSHMMRLVLLTQGTQEQASWIEFRFVSSALGTTLESRWSKRVLSTRSHQCTKMSSHSQIFLLRLLSISWCI